MIRAHLKGGPHDGDVVPLDNLPWRVGDTIRTVEYPPFTHDSWPDIIIEHTYVVDAIDTSGEVWASFLR